jgi:hypothetical protein
MTQAIINLDLMEDRILNIVKAKEGFSNKSKAISFIIGKYAESFLEPELNPKYIQKLKECREEGYGKKYSSTDKLRSDLLD